MSHRDFKPSTERILVVEDDEFSQELIQLYLKKAGFNDLTIVANGRDALDIAKQQAFDLVLLDFNLPRITGGEFLRRLKKEGMLADTPIIISSSVGNMDDIVQCLDLGAEDFLLKPFNVRLLEGRIGAILEKKRLQAQIRAAEDERAADRAATRLLRSALSGIAPGPAGTSLPAAARNLPAAGPGGDFHEVLPLADGSTLFMVGSPADATTAGTLAAARAHTILRRAIDHLAAEGEPVLPHTVLARANRDVCRGSEVRPVTVLLGILSPDRSRVRLANAGGVDPQLVSPRSGVVSLGCDRGRPLGAHPEAVYSDKERDIAADDVVFAFTRGLLEAQNPTGDAFGDAAVKTGLDGCPGLTPEQVVDTLEAEVRRFMAAGAETQGQDITLLAL